MDGHEQKKVHGLRNAPPSQSIRAVDSSRSIDPIEPKVHGSK